MRGGMWDRADGWESRLPAALEGLKGTGKEPGAVESDRGCTCWRVFVKIWQC
jgi:hypothetical protein